MPYYLFEISASSGMDLVKNLVLLDQFETYREARDRAKKLRAEATDTAGVIKVMFAENQLSAEEQLLEKREQPVLMEHER